MICIFCLKEKSQAHLSVEHVFPKSIGGSLVVHTVCKDCNSFLGTQVDSLLTDHILVLIRRIQLGLEGQKGKIFLPFKSGALRSASDSASAPMKAAVRYDNAIKSITGRVINQPFVQKSSAPDLDWYQAHVTIDDRPALEKMFRSLCHQLNLAPNYDCEFETLIDAALSSEPGETHRMVVDNRFIFNCTKSVIEQPLIICAAEKVDTYLYKRAIVKIAYEFACELLGPSYLNDPTGNNLRFFILDQNFLSPPPDRAVTGTINLVSPHNFKSNICEQASNHKVRLAYSSNALDCAVNIFDIIEGRIRVTEDRSLYPLFIPKEVTLDSVRKTKVQRDLTRVLAL